MTIRSYVEARHQDFGVALFVLPVILVGLAVPGFAYCVLLFLG